MPTGGVSIAPGVRVPEGMLRFSFARSGGPGGQNVNKVATKAELRIAVEDLPISGRAKRRLRGLAGRRIVGAAADAAGFESGGDLVLDSESHRSQSQNKAECLEKLRELLVAAMAEPKVRRKTRPTRGSKERRIEAKKQRGEIKRARRTDW